MGFLFGKRKPARKLTQARDLLPGQTIHVGDNAATVVSISYCGSNGEPLRLFGGLNQSVKTAAALKITLDGKEPIYVHPAQAFSTS